MQFLIRFTAGISLPDHLTMYTIIRHCPLHPCCTQIITFRGHFGTIDPAGGLGALALGPFTVVAADVDDGGASELVILSMGSITLKVGTSHSMHDDSHSIRIHAMHSLALCIIS
jgi:hypothetical protein